MKFATKAVHAGIAPDPTTGAIIPPIYQTATYTLEGVGQSKGFDYTRGSNPTRATLEDNIAALEEGKYAVSFASGMATVDAIMRLFSSGDHIISSDDVYGGVVRLFDQILTRYGMEFTYVDSSDPENVVEAIRPNTKMIWVETPTNPLLKVTDLEAVGEVAKANNLLFRALFDAAARKDLHLALIDVPIEIAGHYWPGLEANRKSVTCLRSCLMKPEHLDWIDDIWSTLLAANSGLDD
jgi:cystathionine beta-lyase/cystathionine gamma-synthase